MNTVITYQEMTEQPIGPNNPVEESGGCQAAGVVGLIFLLVCIVAVATIIVKSE